VFAADGRRAVPLGLSRILAGETAFGADGFVTAVASSGPLGIRQFPADERLLERATLLAESVPRAFGLVGVNGVDFIARRGVPYAIEVNPRYTAAMELVERGVRAVAVRPACPGMPARTAGLRPGGRPASHARRGRQGDRYTPGAPPRWATRGPWLLDSEVRDISPPGPPLRAA